MNRLGLQTAVGAVRRVLTSKRARLSVIIAGVIMRSFTRGKHKPLGEQQGSDFTGVGVIWEELSAAESQMWALAVACLTEALAPTVLAAGDTRATAPARSQRWQQQ